MKLTNVRIYRRKLPHWHKKGAMQFVTFHLADSLPKSILERLAAEKVQFYERNPEPWSEETRTTFNRLFTNKINEYLDAGYGSCCLRNPACAEILEKAFFYFEGVKYNILHYVIMPNHAHLLIEIYDQFTLSEICKSWKGYSAKEINKILHTSGKIWHEESWDRIVRDNNHELKVLRYIENNIKSGGVRWMKLDDPR